MMVESEADGRLGGTTPTGPGGTMAALIVLGLVVVGLGVGLRAVLTVTQKVTAKTADGTTVTTTETPFPDSLLAALLGLGGVLIVSGAFYPRISKITLPGGVVIELKDYRTAANLVTSVAAQRLRAAGIDDSVEAAAKVSAATQVAAARLAMLRALSKAEPEAFQALWGDEPDLEAEAFAYREGKVPSERLSTWVAQSAFDEVLGNGAPVAAAKPRGERSR